MVSPGKEVDLTNMFLTQASSCDYENVWRLDVLGLEDTNVGDQGIVYEEFKEQLRSPEGWYEVGLPWKGNHRPLLNNKAGSLKRLNALTKRLEKQPGMLEWYDSVIQDQLAQGTVERVESEAKERENFTYRTNQSSGKQLKVPRCALSMMHIQEQVKKPHP